MRSHTLKNHLFPVGLPLRMTFSIAYRQRRGTPLRALLHGLLLFACLLALSPLQAQSGYIKKYRPLADSLSEKYGIPSSVILGVAIVESGAGNTRTARLLNNHFGIVGVNKLQKTHGVKTRYKQYASVADSYVAFCQLISRRKFYPRLKGQKDYTLWINAISKTGYSERAEEWRKKITSAIQKNKLAK